MGKYPECEKLSAVSGESNKLGSFIDWLAERGIVLAEYPENCRHFKGWAVVNEDCALGHDTEDWHCGKGCKDYTPEKDDILMPTHQSIESILANYFEVDLAVVEKERRQILEDIRNQS